MQKKIAEENAKNAEKYNAKKCFNILSHHNRNIVSHIEHIENPSDPCAFLVHLVVKKTLCFLEL
jgi:hypothetical protein